MRQSRNERDLQQYLSISKEDFEKFAQQMIVAFPFMPESIRNEWADRIKRVRVTVGYCQFGITKAVCDANNDEIIKGRVSEVNNEMIQLIRELRNALIVAANNAHERKTIVNEVKPTYMFYNEMQFRSLVETALEESQNYKAEYENILPLKWMRESSNKIG
jgi:hypothetical protein